MSRKQYSTRLPEDQAEDLEQYCEKRGVSKSEALRRSVEQLTEQNGSSDQSVLYWRIALVSCIVLVAVTEAGILYGFSTVLGALVPATFLAIWALNR